MSRSSDASHTGWLHSPIVWLSAAIFIAAIAACIITIVLAGRYPDTPAAPSGEDSVLRTPLKRA